MILCPEIKSWPIQGVNWNMIYGEVEGVNALDKLHHGHKLLNLV